MTIYIANIDASLGNEDLKNLFTPFGEVASAEVAIDVFTDRPRGFGYVEMPDEEQGRAAVAALNGKEAGGKTITVEESKPRQEHKGSYKVGSGAVNIYKFRKK